MTAPTLPAKSLFTSWTLWLNLAVVLLAAGDQVLGILQPVLGAHTYEVLASVLLAGNTLLRVFKTEAPVSLFGEPWALPDGAGQPKSVLDSKTLWFNVATGVLAALIGGSASPVGEALQAAAGGHLPEIVTGVLAAGNTLLRLVTTQPVSLRGSGDADGHH